MTDFIIEASENDLADQAVFAGEPLEGSEDIESAEPFPVDTEADAADLIEQHRSVPSGDDDYER